MTFLFDMTRKTLKILVMPSLSVSLPSVLIPNRGSHRPVDESCSSLSPANTTSIHKSRSEEVLSELSEIDSCLSRLQVKDESCQFRPVRDTLETEVTSAGQALEMGGVFQRLSQIDEAIIREISARGLFTIEERQAVSIWLQKEKCGGDKALARECAKEEYHHYINSRLKTDAGVLEICALADRHQLSITLVSSDTTNAPNNQFKFTIDPDSGPAVLDRQVTIHHREGHFFFLDPQGNEVYFETGKCLFYALAAAMRDKNIRTEGKFPTANELFQDTRDQLLNQKYFDRVNSLGGVDNLAPVE